MSTCNFSQPNLSKIYALEDIEGDEYGELIQEEITNITEEICKNTIFKPVTNRKYINDKLVIAEAWFDYIYSDGEETNKDSYRMYITAESGYYSGVQIDVSDYDMPEDLSDSDREELQKELDKVEKILSDYTTPIIQIATFSNGEAIYRKV